MAAMRLDGKPANRAQTNRRCAAALFALAAFLVFPASALTVCSKSDLRLWETVTDRSQPLSWPWEAEADSAVLTFSNRLTHTVTSTNITRTVGALRGSCEHPVVAETEDALVAATLAQSADGVVVAYASAEIAYVPGVCCVATGGVATQPIVVRTKEDREWYRVRSPRLSAFDARWWNVTGPSGYEVLWRTPAGPHRVQRAFTDAGIVDEVMLKFGTPGFLLLFR